MLFSVKIYNNQYKCKFSLIKIDRFLETKKAAGKTADSLESNYDINSRIIHR